MTAIQFLVEWLIRSSFLILAGTLALWLARVRNPSIRLAAWSAMLAGSLAVPLLMRSVPIVPIAVRHTYLLPSPPTVVIPASPRVAAGVAAVPTPDFALPPAPPRNTSRTMDWPRIALVAYTLVSGILLLRLAAGLAIARHFRKRSRPASLSPGAFEVRESDRVTSPVTVGILRPVALLPSDWKEWDSMKLNAVLAHEGSHIRRRDPAVQFVSAIHRALLWANPMSWFLDRNIVRAAEDASDDDAIAATRDRASYAGILLEFVQRSAGMAPLTGTPMARYERPEKRIRRVLNAAACARAVTPWGAVGILMLAAPAAYFAAAAHPQTVSLPLAFAAASAVHANIPAPAEPVEVAEAPAPDDESNPTELQAPTPQPDSAAGEAQAQSGAEELPAFEVARIKPTDRTPGAMHECCIKILPGGKVQIQELSLKGLVVAAFGTPIRQVTGGEDWVANETYTIEAQPSEASRPAIKTLRHTWFTIADPQIRRMLQALLIDRFQLKVHHETKIGEVYFMRRNANPLALRPPAESAAAETAADLPIEGLGTVGYAGGRWRVFNTTMPQLARFAADFMLQVPVIDETALSGAFDWWQPQPDLEPKYGEDQSVSFLASMKQVGLKFERGKAPIEYVVIDHAAKPEPN